MKQVSVNVRMDAEIKHQAEVLFESMGLNMTTAVNMFVRQAINERAIPFDIKAPIVDPLYTSERLKRSITQLNEGRGVERHLIEEE
jgi:DNA-damage-inducible protein J